MCLMISGRNQYSIRDLEDVVQTIPILDIQLSIASEDEFQALLARRVGSEGCHYLESNDPRKLSHSSVFFRCSRTARSKGTGACVLGTKAGNNMTAFNGPEDLQYIGD